MSAIKMDELLVSWLSSDDVYENVMELIENYRTATTAGEGGNDEEKKDEGSDRPNSKEDASSPMAENDSNAENDNKKGDSTGESNARLVIPPFYPVTVSGRVRRRRHSTVTQKDTWDPLPFNEQSPLLLSSSMGTDHESRHRSATSESAPPLLPQLNVGSQQQLHSTTAIIATTPTKSKGDDGSADNARGSEGIAGTSPPICVRDQTWALFQELGQDLSPRKQNQHPSLHSHPSLSRSADEDNALIPAAVQDGVGGPNPNTLTKYMTIEPFVRITKDVCGFPSFFNIPLYARILFLWNAQQEELHRSETQTASTSSPSPYLPTEVITFAMFEWYWKTEMEPFDPCDRFFRLVKQVDADAIVRDDFLPFIKALLQDHPGLEFLSSHVEFQEKYAVTVITRIFYAVNKCHSGRITSRQVRLSDLVESFQQVDEEEDINKVTRYFSYEHFYVLYCRFWELDHDRDYRITREDLLKYGDQSLSHMIVDRIFDAAPRPFEQQLQQPTGSGGAQIVPTAHRDYLSYEDFIYFMLSEEDKSNEVSVRYWFTCVDVDGDGKLNNMEMRSFYAVQLHRMQFMGHEIVPFEDMLCQMMDMIKPQNTDFLVESDFLQPECRQVSGALFDALFNLNKYLLFEQRDPFVERQKREDEFDCDWDRFACLDYSRLAMEEEAREEEAMEIDWVSVDDDAEGGGPGGDDGHSDDDDDLDDDDDDDSESDLQGAAMLGGSSGGVSEAPF